MAAKKNGAAVLTETLAAAGVKTIFSLSGNQIMPVYDACIDSGIRIVHVRHEAAAVAMADAYAQITGGIGVALVTAAPGFANALSPLYSAHTAESPVLLISGDSPVAQDGCGAFQELEQKTVVGPLVKGSFRPLHGAEVATTTAEAIRLARTGRQGPVHIALPFDVAEQATSAAPITDPTAFDAADRPLSPHSTSEIAALLDSAKRPLIILGPQFNSSRGGGAPAELSKTFGVPVVAMESPRGLRDPSLGGFSEMVGEADLLVLLGKQVDFTLGFLKPGIISAGTGIVVIDPESAAIDQARKLCGSKLLHAAQADVSSAIEALCAAGNSSPPSAWHDRVVKGIRWRETRQDASGRRHPVAVCEAIAAVLEQAEDPILICDGGEFGQWAQAFCEAPTRIVNGCSGAIGNGLAYAIAAKIARPHATVVAVMGDGTVGFHLAEFETAAREGAAFVAVVGNDSCWNAEHQIQLRDFGPDRLIGCSLSPRARYDQAAAALGCHGAFVENSAELGNALEAAVSSNRPALVNVIIDGAPAPVFTSRGQAASAEH